MNEDKGLKRFEIHFEDLTEEAQNRLCELIGDEEEHALGPLAILEFFTEDCCANCAHFSVEETTVSGVVQPEDNENPNEILHKCIKKTQEVGFHIWVEPDYWCESFTE